MNIFLRKEAEREPEKKQQISGIAVFLPWSGSYQERYFFLKVASKLQFLGNLVRTTWKERCRNSAIQACIYECMKKYRKGRQGRHTYYRVISYKCAFWNLNSSLNTYNESKMKEDKILMIGKFMMGEHWIPSDGAKGDKFSVSLD